MYRGIIFDLDGVLISTDYYHYLAWKRLADEEKIAFDIVMNEKLRGVSRSECLDIILGSRKHNYNKNEIQEMLKRKNSYYLEHINDMKFSDLDTGIIDVIKYLRENNLKLAVGSSSRNAEFILKKINIFDKFDVVITGNDILKSKPDPEVFTLAAKRLKLNPNECLVIEDADAGVLAAINGGFDVLGLGSAYYNKKATYNDIKLTLPVIKKYIKEGEKYENKILQ